jgi:hypothetical protein
MTPTQPVYSLDTSGLLDGIERHYPPATFPGLWERVDDLILNGRLLMSEEAINEAMYLDAAARAWCDPRKDSITVATNQAIAAHVSSIVTEFRVWTGGTTNRADPFVIAVAMEHAAVVVTGEKPGSIQNPKIPFVCKARGVPCTNFLGLVTRENWVFP